MQHGLFWSHPAVVPALCSSYQTLGVALGDGPQAHLKDITSTLFPNKDITVYLSFLIGEGVP